MRHIYAYRITYLLAAVIVAAAVLFAWLRSQELVLVPKHEVGGKAATTFRGDRYKDACSACHGELPYLGEVAAARQLELAPDEVREKRSALAARE